MPPLFSSGRGREDDVGLARGRGLAVGRLQPGVCASDETGGDREGGIYPCSQNPTGRQGKGRTRPPPGTRTSAFIPLRPVGLHLDILSHSCPLGYGEDQNVLCVRLGYFVQALLPRRLAQRSELHGVPIPIFGRQQMIIHSLPAPRNQ